MSCEHATAAGGQTAPQEFEENNLSEVKRGVAVLSGKGGVGMPPGTADVALTVFQSLPVDGIVIVTSPQDLVSMIVAKAVNMAEKMNSPVLGIVENMAYVEFPDCVKTIEVFGPSKLDAFAGN